MDKPSNTAAPTPGYETRDANAVGVSGFLAALGVVIVLVTLACWGFFGYYSAHLANASASVSPFVGTRQLPLGPQLQPTPREDWLKYRQNQEKSLETYEWVNRSAGTVRVPIEKAMELLVKKGVPVQAEPQSGAPTKSAPAGSEKQ
jgi:hypothetical protein